MNKKELTEADTAFGTPVEIVKLFGGKQNYLAAIHELEAALYSKAT